MQPLIEASVFIVDDDASVREALAWLLRSRRLSSESFASAQAFQKRLKDRRLPQHACCLLLDVRMPGLSGLALFDWLIQQNLHPTLPVIFLTGHGDVAMAVEAVKRGAFDFCEKPFSDNALVDRIEQALALSASLVQGQKESSVLRERLTELTERERAVMNLVVAGLPNKSIASQLEISVRTVEVHRARVFEKMDVKSAVELANLLRNV